MSFNRYDRRTDLNQQEIVAALRKVGVLVYIIGAPVDLLCYYRGRFQPIELKSTKRRRKDQDRQQAFVEQTGCPVVRTCQEALDALGIGIESSTGRENSPNVDRASHAAL